MSVNGSKKYFFVDFSNLKTMDLFTKTYFDVSEEALKLHIPYNFHYFVMAIDEQQFSYNYLYCHEWVSSHPFKIIRQKIKEKISNQKIISMYYNDNITVTTPIIEKTGEDIGKFFQKLHELDLYESYKMLMNKLFNQEKMLEDRRNDFKREMTETSRKRQRKMRSVEKRL